MREELERESRKQFRQMMGLKFPEFHEDKDQAVTKHKYVRTWRHPSGIWFHIVLVTHHLRDAFTAEGAWDMNDRLPDFDVVFTDEQERILEQPILFRPGFLWSGHDFWWSLDPDRAFPFKEETVEDCLPQVAPAIQDVADKLKKHVMPLFEAVVKKHGKSGGQ